MRAQLGLVEDLHGSNMLSAAALSRWIDDRIEDRILQIYEGKR